MTRYAVKRLPDRMTTNQAATYLGVHKTTLYTYMKRGMISYHVKRNGRRWFKRTELDAFLIHDTVQTAVQNVVSESGGLRYEQGG